MISPAGHAYSPIKAAKADHLAKNDFMSPMLVLGSLCAITQLSKTRAPSACGATSLANSVDWFHVFRA